MAMAMAIRMGTIINHFVKSARWGHYVECLKNSNKCFSCGEAGYLKKNFPKNKDQKAAVPTKLNASNTGDVVWNNLI